MTRPSPPPGALTPDRSREVPHGAPAGSAYLDRLMRRGSFEALWPLFALATRPAKELTESFSALVHLRPLLPPEGPFRVIHVGDGAHARTAALFALKTRGDSISVDPLLNHGLVEQWRARFAIQRLELLRADIRDAAPTLNALPDVPTFVTFVHAHVSTDDTLDALRWDAAFTLACCVPGKQLSRAHTVLRSGTDAEVLSTERTYQVLVNGDRAR